MFILFLGYLVLAWRTLALSVGREFDSLPVIFDDVKIDEATILHREGKLFSLFIG